MMYRSILCFLSCVMIVSSCSGPGADGGRAAESSLRFNLGTSARSHIVATTEDAFLSRYGYRLNRQVDTAEDVRMETSWKDVTTLADEQAAGYLEARVRIFITARPRNRASGTGSTYTARMIIEYEARVSISGDWEQVPITPEREAYIKDIAEYLENEFKGGVM